MMGADFPNGVNFPPVPRFPNEEPMADAAYIFGAGASYACSSKTPLITQFFSKAKALGGLCETIGADLTKSINRSLALAETELLDGSLNLQPPLKFAGWRSLRENGRRYQWR